MPITHGSKKSAGKYGSHEHQDTQRERAEERFPAFKVMDWTRRQEGYATCIREEVEPREAEVVKLRALVQELVNGVGKLAHRQACALAQSVIGGYDNHPECNCGKDRALNAAKEHGFVPTHTTEG